MRAVLKPLLEILAGIPTVVFGYFALTFVTPLLRDLGLGVEVFNALSAGLVMGIMLLPTVASLSEDAMAAVPQALRQGGYALGANRLQVSLRIVVPAALSGIVASFVLAISRAVGETMIVTIAAGLQPTLTLDPRVAVETLTAFIASTAGGDVPTGIDRVQDDLRGRAGAVRHHADPEPVRDPARAQIPRGLRMRLRQGLFRAALLASRRRRPVRARRTRRARRDRRLGVPRLDAAQQPAVERLDDRRRAPGDPRDAGLMAI